ncbi:hypothetical protein N040_01185 [Serratia marcescens EGD-HP20]|nr:hypothetical protein N040_01185 [Serratia marcescens EGD-HP20]
MFNYLKIKVVLVVISAAAALMNKAFNMALIVARKYGLTLMLCLTAKPGLFATKARRQHMPKAITMAY